MHWITWKEDNQRKEDRFNCQYKNLEMAEYLPPTCELNNKEKRKMFEIRNDMTKMEMKVCAFVVKRKIWNTYMKHIYDCELFNEKDRPIMPYEQIFNGNMKQQIYVYKKLKQNLERRE